MVRLSPSEMQHIEFEMYVSYDTMSRWTDKQQAVSLSIKISNLHQPRHGRGESERVRIDLFVEE
jgi:hypothetical protein